MKLPKTQTAVNLGVVVAAVVTTVALGAVAWPALTRPDPPTESTGDGGLRIRLVQPPKAAVPKAGPLDVGLSETAQAMAENRAALLTAMPAPALVQSPRADEGLAPPGPVDGGWERERTGSGFALARQMREEERADRRERERREAQEQADRDRRWDDEREQDRYDQLSHDGQDEPPPPPDGAPPPPGWR